MDSGDFRKRAEYARDEAKLASKGSRAAWLQIAAAYDRLADDIDKQEAKPKARRVRRPQWPASYQDADSDVLAADD